MAEPITTRDVHKYDGMSRDEFIAYHVRHCQAGRAKKYDNTKSASAAHSLEYSRRKCAKKIWKDLQGRRRRKRSG